MNPLNYITFQLDIALLFDKKKAPNEIEAYFDQLITLEDFDGLKNYESGRAKITSSDNSFVLSMTSREFKLQFFNFNTKSQTNVTQSLEKLPKIFNKAIRKIDIDTAKKVRVGKISFSPKKVDRDYLAGKLINEEYYEDLDNYGVVLDITNKETFPKSKSYLEITTRHTIDMHDTLAELNATKTQISVRELRILGSSGTIEDALLFIESSLGELMNIVNLKRFGYVQERK